MQIISLHTIVLPECFKIVIGKVFEMVEELGYVTKVSHFYLSGPTQEPSSIHSPDKLVRRGISDSKATVVSLAIFIDNLH